MKADIPAQSIGYPEEGNKYQLQTLNNKMQQRIRDGIPGGWGNITEADKRRIEDARAKRARKAAKAATHG